MFPINRTEYEPRFKTHWDRFVSSFDLKEEAAGKVYHQLSKKYGDETRYDPSMQHVVFLLDELAILRQQMPKWFSNPTENASIEFALWMLGFFRDRARDDNEKVNAQIAEEYARELGFAKSVGHLSASYILALNHKTIPSEPGAQIVCDLQFAWLGQDWNDFRMNLLLLRQEHSYLTKAAFNDRQRQIFQDLLNPQIRPCIFQTDYFYERLEQLARINMRKAIRTDLRD